jgi:hypothetical protein
MNTESKKSITHYMRSLHRDIGYFLIGLTIIYCISGILLIYRETGFLKSEKQIEKQLSANIEPSELGKVLHKRGFEVLKTEGDIIWFENGSYNKATGIATYSDKTLPSFLERFNNLHKGSTKNITHWLSVAFGILLLFLAISSFWMFKPKTKMFRRGLILAGSGLIFALVLLFF